VKKHREAVKYGKLAERLGAVASRIDTVSKMAVRQCLAAFYPNVTLLLCRALQVCPHAIRIGCPHVSLTSHLFQSTQCRSQTALMLECRRKFGPH